MTCIFQERSLQSSGYFVIPSDPVPICTPDGYFAKLQKVSNNTNFCSDRKGQPIEDFLNIPSDSKQGKSMNCECALARNYLNEYSRKPVCCSNGNFVSKQCVAGFCFCVDQYGRQISQEKDQIEDITCQDFCCEQNNYPENHFCSQ